MALIETSALKTAFQTDDVPVQSDYENIFDSFVSKADTSAQSIASPLTVPSLTATNATFTSASAVRLSVAEATITSANISGGTATFATVSASIITTNILKSLNVGQAVLVSGSVSVANTGIVAKSRIFLTVASADAAVATPFIESVTTGAGFKIASTDNSDESTINWFIVEEV